MKIGLVGWGVETRSAYRYFGDGHEYLIVSEQPITEPPTGDNVHIQTLQIERTTGDAGAIDDLIYMQGIEGCDSVIYSPVAWNNLTKYAGENSELLKKCQTVLDIFFEHVDRRKIVGVTGTKGKTTTTTLLYEFLKKAGKNVRLGGNVGTSPLDFIDDMRADDAIAVIEMSSYQLQNLAVSPHVAVLLGITPEHLDWHGTFEAYATAKSHITSHQTDEDHLVYVQSNDATNAIATKSGAQKHPCPANQPLMWLEGELLKFRSGQTLVWDQLHLKGAHNLLNIEAALLAYGLFVQDLEPAVQALKEFAGIPHRLAFVAEVDGVKYYNDSIASTPDSALAGLRAFSESVVLLTGGHNRGLDLTQYVQALNEERAHIRHIVCFGEVAPKLKSLLNGLDLSYTVVEKPDMRAVVEVAKSHALEGDVVLLSPGFSSYDMYRKYDERGDDFVRNVLEQR